MLNVVDGVITGQDLKEYTAVWTKPLNITLRNGGYVVHTPPPPSGGAVLLHALGILDGSVIIQTCSFQ